MAGLEPLAVLQERAAAFDVPEATLLLLTNNGANSLAKLAFMSQYQAGQPDEGPLLEPLEAVMGRAPTGAEKPVLRRFEADTATLADAKARLERTDVSEARKIPMAERASRATLQKARLASVVITLDNEPSHALVDKVFQQLEDTCVSWIPWFQLTSRAQESVSIKKVVSFQLDASGGLKATTKDDGVEARLAGDASLRQALQRWALAYDLSRMVEYTTLETWTEVLFAEVLRDPPKMYRAVSLKLWQLVSECTRGKVAM